MTWLGQGGKQASGDAGNFLLFMPVASRPLEAVDVLPFATGLDTPTVITHAPGDDRLFVAEKGGTIRVVDAGGTLLPAPFLTLEVGGEFEQGLLGLAFHPDYASNGYFYVNYTDPGGDTYLSRFSVDPQDPSRADPASELVLLFLPQPSERHNAGDLHFGPDGYLYMATGDGGPAGDPDGNAQNPQSLLGKILRLDVDAGTPYAIPPDNPFAGNPDGRDEIWALGLRNPWRFSFDRATGDMYVGDVGEGLWEEVDFQAAGTPGGLNFGWRCYEGSHPFVDFDCGGPEQYVFPIVEYGHEQEPPTCSVVGGYVYRGQDYQAMRGRYFFADFCSGQIWSLFPGPEGWEKEALGQFSPSWTTFGQDVNGELYLGGYGDDTIYRLVPAS